MLLKFFAPGPFLTLILAINSHDLFGLDLDLADIQLFGDVYLSAQSIAQTQTTQERPNIFSESIPLLATSRVNIINFEGAATKHFDPMETKSYLLKMPSNAPLILKSAGIHVAVLANNHSMDFGELGLLDSIEYLGKAQIHAIGAGLNKNDALRPLQVVLPQRNENQARSICLAAFSSTFPDAFWATETKSGTAHGSPENIYKSVSNCKKQGAFTIAIFHWGTERQQYPHSLQRSLAHMSIEAGADLVVGHHPHVLQSIETHKKKLIFYSLGNFAFSSRPENSQPEGMSLRIKFAPEKDQALIELVPLAVNNGIVKFVPRMLTSDDYDPVARIVGDAVRKFPHQVWKKSTTPLRWSTTIATGSISSTH